MKISIILVGLILLITSQGYGQNIYENYSVTHCSDNQLAAACPHTTPCPDTKCESCGDGLDCWCNKACTDNTANCCCSTRTHANLEIIQNPYNLFSMFNSQ
jgi:hypothetical protein